jgi:hypothetical protein
MFNLTKKNENFREAFIYRNKALSVGIRDNGLLDESKFTVDFFNTYSNIIKNLRVCDLYVDNNYVGFNAFRTNCNIPLTLQNYQMLKGIVETALVRYRKTLPEQQTTVDVVTFVNRSKRGSKRFRNILIPCTADYIPHNIVKFRDNVDVVVGSDCAKRINSSWNNQLFSNSTRTFLFKLYNNTLGYNNAVAHFVRNHSPNCTFCDIAGVQETFNETPLHLFFTCDSTEPFVDNMFKWFVNDNNFEFSRKEFFIMFDSPTFSPAKNQLLTVFSKLLLKFLWDSKQRYNLPCLIHGKITISSELTSIIETNKKFKNIFHSAGHLAILDV